MRKHLCKSYIQLANKEFKRKHDRWPDKQDSQELYDIYENQWRDYYVEKPLREKLNKEKGRQLWQHGIKYRVDVYYALCRFIELKYGTLIKGKYGNQYYEKSCGELCKEMGIEFMESHIVDNGLTSEWKQFIDNNHTTLKKHHKREYVDYSHLAYNGVTDDF
jgi:hypothetical protein